MDEAQRQNWAEYHIMASIVKYRSTKSVQTQRGSY